MRRTKNLDFFAAGRDSTSILVASACSRALPSVLSGVPGRPWGLSGRSRDAPEAPRDTPKALPRRSQDPFGMLLGASGRPERLPGAIFSRFWVPQGSILTRKREDEKTREREDEKTSSRVVLPKIPEIPENPRKRENDKTRTRGELEHEKTRKRESEKTRNEENESTRKQENETARTR